MCSGVCKYDLKIAYEAGKIVNETYFNVCSVIFINETLRMLYWHLVEQIKILSRSENWAIFS